MKKKFSKVQQFFQLCSTFFLLLKLSLNTVVLVWVLLEADSKFEYFSVCVCVCVCVCVGLEGELQEAWARGLETQDVGGRKWG